MSYIYIYIYIYDYYYYYIIYIYNFVGSIEYKKYKYLCFLYFINPTKLCINLNLSKKMCIKILYSYNMKRNA